MKINNINTAIRLINKRNKIVNEMQEMWYRVYDLYLPENDPEIADRLHKILSNIEGIQTYAMDDGKAILNRLKLLKEPSN